MTVKVFRQGSELADGRYVLERRLGAGGMATVWLATDTRLQRRVAIKLPSEVLTADRTFGRRFEREARSAAAVSHPNLVPVYDYGCEGERPYLVSEFIDGASLAEMRERGVAPSVEPLARALLGALGEIHEAGIVHRDVKPANVLVEDPGRIMLTDFGIAQSTEETRLTKTGHVIGTYDYLAPEVRRGDRAGPTSDLFACGVVLAEQLSESDPDRFHRLVSRLTAPSPAGRPASAAAALDLLDPGDSTTAATPAEEATEATAAMPIQRSPSAAPPLPPAPPPPAALPPRSEPRSPRRVLEESGRGAEVPPPRPASGAGFPWRAAVLTLLGVAALIAAVVALAGGGGDDPRPERASSTQGGGGDRSTTTDDSTVADPSTTTTDSTTPTETTVEEPTTPVVEPDPARGAALNDQGFALIQQGEFEGALPILEESVSLFPEDSTETVYAFALFNYAQALRETGDPAAAIPLLERRLSFSDNQVDVVQAELELSRQLAGEG